EGCDRAAPADDTHPQPLHRRPVAVGAVPDAGPVEVAEAGDLRDHVPEARREQETPRPRRSSIDELQLEAVTGAICILHAACDAFRPRRFRLLPADLSELVRSGIRETQVPMNRPGRRVSRLIRVDQADTHAISGE